MCFGCEYAKENDYGYKIFYACQLKNEIAEVVDTYFNESEVFVECPKMIKETET
jgi:hypothetical protein